MGKLVDFIIFLDDKSRVYGKCKYTDPKKVATCKLNNAFICNSVKRFYSAVCKKTKLSLANKESRLQVFKMIEEPMLVQTFLKDLAVSGRKQQAVFLYLNNLHTFHKFLIKCGILPESDAFKRLKEDVGAEFPPLVQFNSDCLYKQRCETIEVENFPVEKLLFLLQGNEINMVGRRWCSFDFPGATLSALRAVLDIVCGVMYLNIQAHNVGRSGDNTTVAVSAFEKSLKS